MANWTGTVTLTAEQLESLDRFIHEPYTRVSDIFQRGRLEVDSHFAVDWIIKHDLFEGVVAHFSLMSHDGSTFFVGTEQTLSRVDDWFQDYAIEHDNRRYMITTSPTKG